jgi:D-alanine-D-alanine ligase
MALLHVAVLANLKKNAPILPDMPSDYWDDLDSEHTVEAIADALRQRGYRVTFLEGDVTLYDRLREVRPDICFNICEGHFGDSREAQVPAILEMLRIPYTGSQVLTLALALDKAMTKRVLTFHDLPTSPFARALVWGSAPSPSSTTSPS